MTDGLPMDIDTNIVMIVAFLTVFGVGSLVAVDYIKASRAQFITRTIVKQLVDLKIPLEMCYISIAAVIFPAQRLMGAPMVWETHPQEMAMAGAMAGVVVVEVIKNIRHNLLRA